MTVYLIQFLTGLSHAATLFLVASGLSIIFGVTRIVNFAHGSFYMLGRLRGLQLRPQFLMERLGAPLGFWTGIVLAALAVGVVGVVMEILLLRRIYRAPELFQLLATFGVVLVVQDAALAIWGREDLFAPRAPGLKGDRGDPRRALPAVSPVSDRARSRRARRAVAAVPSHALGRAGARRDAGPGDGRRAGRERALAVHQRAVPRLVPGRTGRRAADPQGSGEPADGHPHHRRGLRGGGDRRDGQRDRRLSRGAAGGPAVGLRHPASSRSSRWC